MTRSIRPTLFLLALSLAVAIPPHNERAPHAAPNAARPHPAPILVDNDDWMAVNNLNMAVSNVGWFGYDFAIGNAGLEYPKGTGRAVLYAGGLWIGARVNGGERVAIAEYSTEYTPGPMSGGTFLPDQPSFRNYRIDRGDTTGVDYLNWPVADGAPTDALGKPLLLGDATIWSVYNDADPNAHGNASGATAPLGVEVRQTTFAFNRSGALGRTIFVVWKLVNRGGNTLNSAYVSIWTDPDVGGFTDDLVGCDSTRSLGYCYNATNADPVYGSSPPAVGIGLLQGPIVEVSPGVTDTLGMTAFAGFPNGADPQNSVETYRIMQGLAADGSPMHVQDDPLQPVTTYSVSGLSPGAASGPANWLDSSPGDRRMTLSSGPFTMAPGDSQEIIVAVMVGQGPDRLASIADLRSVHDVLAPLYRNGFDPQIPIAVEAFAMEAEVAADRVRLAWSVSDESDLLGWVERRTRASEWAEIGGPIAPVARTVRFEDTDVEPGTAYGYRLRIASGTEATYSGETWVEVPATAAPPAAPALRPGYPNPAAGWSRWSYYVPRGGHARLAVWDARGRLVRVLIDGEIAAGWRESPWDGRDSRGRAVASGSYFVRLETAGAVETRKVVISR